MGMERDYEINENDEINEKLVFFGLFRHFRLFRNPSSFSLTFDILGRHIYYLPESF